MVCKKCGNDETQTDEKIFAKKNKTLQWLISG